MMIIRPSIAFLLFAFTMSAWSQEGDPAAGRSKAATCAACHGPDGNSTNPEWPKIAGQHGRYLYKQLMDFKEQTARHNAMMTGMVAPLSDQDMRDLGAFYASMQMSGGFADEQLVALGEKIYRGGNKESGVPACIGCHGPTGAGDPRAGFPRLAGQHATYTEMQLKNFYSGARSNDPKSMMRDIALKLTPTEMTAVSSYISGLH